MARRVARRASTPRSSAGPGGSPPRAPASGAQVPSEGEPIFASGVALRCLVLAGVAIAIYLACLANGFTQDDFLYVLRDRQVRIAPWRLFVEPYLASPVYRPVTILTYAFNFATGGDSATGFHALNVALHAAVVVVLYLFLRELLFAAASSPGGDRATASGARSTARTHAPAEGGFDVAFAAALLFAAHPIHVEAVAAVVGRSELLAAGFAFAAWLFHLRDRALPAAACFLVALAAKESAIVLPVLVIAGDLACRRGLRLRAYAPLGVALAVFFIARWNAIGAPSPARGSLLDNPLTDLPFWPRLPAALVVALRYAALHVFPATLSADYSYDSLPWTREPIALAGATIAVVALVGAWIWSLRVDRRVFLAGLIYVGGFAVTANVLVPIGTILGERLAYFPSAGACLLAALALGWLAARRREVALAVLWIAAGALAVRSVVRIFDWRDNLSLFTAAARAFPNNAKARHNLGVELLDRGDLAGAREQLDAAYRIHPDYPDLLASLGVLAYRSGDKEGAARWMRAGVEGSGPGNNNYEERVVNYSGVLIELGRDGEAVDLLSGLLRIAPSNARAYNARGIAYFRRGMVDQARADLTRAIELNPQDQQARALLAELDGRTRPPAPAAR